MTQEDGKIGSYGLSRRSSQPVDSTQKYASHWDEQHPPMTHPRCMGSCIALGKVALNLEIFTCMHTAHTYTGALMPK